MLVLCRAFVALFLVVQTRRPRSADYLHGGERYAVDGERTSSISTRFGRVVFTRPVGRQVRDHRATCDLSVDRELGLCAGFSLGVVVTMTRLCAQLAFASARSTYEHFQGWAPSPRAALRMVDAAGEEARAFLEASPPPDDDGEILVIQVDAKGAPMISSTENRRRRQPHRQPKGTRRAGRRLRRRAWPRKRRTKGKKSKNAKMAVVGVLYTLQNTADGMEGPIGKRLYATFTSHEALFVWLRREADKRGYGRKQSLFLGDGCPHIWYWQKKYFPDAETCLDWFHVVEKLWSAGECLHSEGSRELSEWMAQQTERLHRGAIRTILRMLGEQLAAIPKTGPGNKGKRQRLGDIAAHFAKHRHRMRYGDLRRRDLDIGTGAAEGAVRNLVGMRFDGPGMRWSRGRAERLLHLRCILLNGQWDDFAAYLARRGDLRLAAQPISTETHDAKAAA